MTQVINLGMTQRRESPISGLSEGLASGMQMGLTAQTLKQREKERKTREVAEENALSSKLADQGLRKREQDIKHVRGTHDDFSTWWNGMNEQEKAIAKTSDQYKEFQKFFKSFSSLTPGLVKDDGAIVASSTKSLITRKLDNRIAQAKLNYGDGKATQEDVQLLQLTESNKEKISEVLAEVSEKLTPQEAGDVRGFMQKFKDAIAGFKGQPRASTSTQEALVTPQGTQVTQPQAPVMGNPMTDALADPLGAFK